MVKTSSTRAIAPSTRAVERAVEKVLCSTGSPLDASTQSAFSARFGHDFSRVRVHTDRNAAWSAQSVHARAFTAGNHIVFDSGEYAPHAEQGRRLLAHELTHVIQQSVVGQQTPAAPVPRSVAASTDPAEREAERVASDFCSSSIAPAVRTAASATTLYRQAEETTCFDSSLRDAAVATIEKARERLATIEGLDPAKPTPDQKIALRGLSRHFAIGAANVKTHLETLRERLQAIASFVESTSADNVQCASPEENSCGIADALVRRDENGVPIMLFCQSFFGKGALLKQETFIHEAAHAADPEIKDWVYTGQRAYPLVSTGVALENADSYSHFIIEMRETVSGEQRELSLGHTQKRDKFEECGEQKGRLSQALAEAELANYEALRVFSDPELVKARGERLAWFNIIRRTGPGCEPNQALVQRHRKLYEATDKLLGKGLRIQCDSSEDCEGGPVHYEDGILQVCLKWDRAVSRFPFFGWAHAILQGLHVHIEGGVAMGEVPGAPKEFRTGSAASIASWMIWEKRSEGRSDASNPFFCAPPPELLRPGSAKPGTRTRDVVRKGDQGCPVPELQEKLRVLGDRTLKVNGVFDAATELALIRFQEAEQLLEAGAGKGTADAPTWTRLFEKLPGHHGMPTGERFILGGFRKDDEITMLDFQQQLLPLTINFKGCRVTEVDPGGGINTCCTGSLCHTKITGGTWTVGDDNTYGPDTVGLIAPQVRRYQLGPDRRTCFYLVPQIMVVDLPEGPFEYVRNAQLYVITKDTVTCSKINQHDRKQDSMKFPQDSAKDSG